MCFHKFKRGIETASGLLRFLFTDVGCSGRLDVTRRSKRDKSSKKGMTTQATTATARDCSRNVGKARQIPVIRTYVIHVCQGKANESDYVRNGTVSPKTATPPLYRSRHTSNETEPSDRWRGRAWETWKLSHKIIATQQNGQRFAQGVRSLLLLTGCTSVTTIRGRYASALSAVDRPSSEHAWVRNICQSSPPENERVPER
jgi:hypothetical protein